MREQWKVTGSSLHETQCHVFQANGIWGYRVWNGSSLWGGRVGEMHICTTQLCPMGDLIHMSHRHIKYKMMLSFFVGRRSPRPSELSTTAGGWEYRIYDLPFSRRPVVTRSLRPRFSQVRRRGMTDALLGKKRAGTCPNANSWKFMPTANCFFSLGPLAVRS